MEHGAQVMVAASCRVCKAPREAQGDGAGSRRVGVRVRAACMRVGYA